MDEVSGIRHSSIFKGPVILPRHKRAFTSLNLMNNRTTRAISANVQSYIEIDVYGNDDDEGSINRD